MAPLSINNLKPKDALSTRTAAKELRDSLEHIFAQIGDGNNLWLVGGTALAGFYAEHRRSDDLDLFAANQTTFADTIRAVDSLKKNGVIFLNEKRSPFYYRAGVQSKNQKFTVDVVLDENIHRFGNAIKTKSGVWVADLATLLATKIATLVSRSSEKDLFDLHWLLDRPHNYKTADLIKIGAEVDGGFNAESALFVLKEAILREEACGFVLHPTKKEIKNAYHIICNLRKKLIAQFVTYVAARPLGKNAGELKQAIKNDKKK